MLLLPLLGGLPARAEGPDTLWTYAIGSSFFHVINAKDGNTVVAGVQYDEFTQNDVLLVKFDPHGSIIWSFSYVTDSADLWLAEQPRALLEMTDGLLALLVSNIYGDVYLMIIDEDGQRVSHVKLLSWEEGYSLDGWCLTADGNLVGVGARQVWSDPDWLSFACLRKMDVAGNVLWETSYSPAVNTDFFNLVKELPDGNFIALGRSISGSEHKLLLARTNASGDTLWMKRWEKQEFNNANAFEITPGGGCVVAGYHSYYGDELGFLAAFDKNGNENWYRTYDNIGEDNIRAVSKTFDGGFITTGYVGGSSADLWVMKTDSGGAMLTSVIMGSDQLPEYGYAIVQSPDSAYIVAGNRGSDGYVVKLRGDATLSAVGQVSTAPEVFLDDAVPNPFTSATVLTFSLAKTGPVILGIYDVAGREVQMILRETRCAGIHRVVYDGTALSSGTFMIKLQTPEVVLTRQLIHVQ